MQDRMDAGHVRCKTGWMQLRSDAGGQVICITGLMQDRKEAVQDRYRIGRMQYQYRTYAVHDRCSTGHMQCMTDAVQDIPVCSA